MKQTIINHIKEYVPFNEEILVQISESFEQFQFNKRSLVLEEGELCPYIYFVAKGCLRLYYLDGKGVEQTLQFALENWWMTDIDAFHKKLKSSYSIQALEDTILLGITKKDFDSLLNLHPKLEKYFRIIYEKAYSASLFKMKVHRLSKDEIYHSFSEGFPKFTQRVPQKILASFLGFTPEYLSELRKKKFNN